MRSKQQGGFIKLIIILVIVLIVLGYFGFNLKNIIQSQGVTDNLNYAWGLVLEAWAMAQSAWDKFIVTPFLFLKDKIAAIFS